MLHCHEHGPDELALAVPLRAHRAVEGRPRSAPLPGARPAGHLYETAGPEIFSRSLLKRIFSLQGYVHERYDAGPNAALERHLGATQLREALTPVLVPAYELEARAAFFLHGLDAPHARAHRRHPAPLAVDAAATPMLGSFTDAPDPTPYGARVPEVDYRTPNPPGAPLAAASARPGHRAPRPRGSRALQPGDLERASAALVARCPRRSTACGRSPRRSGRRRRSAEPRDP